MPTLKTETLPIRKEADLVALRQMVRAWSIDLRFSLVDQTKLVTAASELGRNAMIYGGGGDVILEVLEGDNKQQGVGLTFVDQGPGIPNVEAAMKDGFTSGNGMGLGLGGSRRLVNDFHIESAVGKGTTVRIVRWK